jgi:acetylornithine deacetylase
LIEILSLPPIRFATVDGLPTSVVSFATDVPVFGKTWGEPLLLGPGSIHVAHTPEERISKQELADAAGMYADVVKKLLAKA